MTLDEMRASDKTMLVPSDVAEVLGVKPHSINCQAKDGIDKLGFNVALVGTRVLIPRKAFLKWLGVEE